MPTTTYGPSRAPKVLLVIGALLLVVVLAASIFWSATTAPSSATAASPTPSPSATTTTPACEPAYVQVAATHANGRVIDDFETRYAAATAQANNLSDAQRNLLIEESGKDAQTLAAWAHAFGLYQDPNNWQSLVSNNCLSPEGQKLQNQFEGALRATGSTFQEAQAPADGFNSGINNGVYGVATTAGVTGNRKAIKVTLQNGTVVYIMVRCGNPVYPGKPNLPTVPTDNTPPPTVYKCVAPTPYGTWPVCKDASSNDPYPRGHAPAGGGTNADPGPGAYKGPDQMQQPPSTPRVNPVPPAATPPASSGGSSPTPTRDPAPTPTPEPKAPAPAAPATECYPIQGVETCS